MSDGKNSGDIKRNSGLLKTSLGVTFATLLSRMLGLVRVRLEANVLGGGDVASGWFLAFAIPNMLRKILGEGALGQALMPLVAEIDGSGDRDGMKKGLGTVFFVLGFILAAIVLLVSLITFAVSRMEFIQSLELFRTERMKIIMGLLPLLMPYGFFMCLVGVAGCVLNYCKEFFLPALGALLLNIFLISGLAAAFFFHQNDLHKVLGNLAWLVLLSGFIQLVLMFLLLRRNNSFPDFRKTFSFKSFTNPLIKKLFKTALPGIIGGIAVDVSFLVDRMLAVYLGARAVPALTYVDRLIDIPIGIFAISICNVLMSEMSRSAAKEDMELFVNDLQFAIRQVFFFCVPMAAGVIFFFDILMSVFCLGGRYTAADLEAARMVAMFYGAGIPVFCLLKVIVTAFNSRKKMQITLYASLCAIVLNIILNIILMQFMQQGGIALATVAASVVNCTILFCVLKKEALAPAVTPLALTLLRTVIVAAVSAFLAALLVKFAVAGENNLMVSVIKLGVVGISFSVCYFGLSALLRAPEVREFSDILKHRKKA